jgi:hypothetical protein
MRAARPCSVFLCTAVLALCAGLPAVVDACSEHVHGHAASMPKAIAPAGQRAIDGPRWAGAALTGAWFDTARNGEGIDVQVLPDGSAFAVWFTYPPAGEPGEQAWLLAQGSVVDGATLRFSQVVRPNGARFGDAFDPAAVVNAPWGTLSLTVEDCNALRLDYAGPAAWGSGQRRLTRLTAADQADCNGGRSTLATGGRAAEGLRARSGTWYVPGRDGEGWLVEDLAGGLSGVYWFTHDPQGRQAWIFGIGTRSGTRIAVAAATITRGTRFGDGFDAAAVQRDPWGTLDVDFSDCGRARFAWTSTRAGYGAGTREAVRLSRVAGAPCLDDTGPARTRVTWTEIAPIPSPAQSELAATALDGRFYVLGGYGDLRGFKRYDPATGAWQRLADLPAGRHHLAAFAFDGAVYFSGGATEGGGDQSAGGYRHDLATGRWDAVPALQYNFGSHAAVLFGRAYVGNEDGSLREFDPRSGRARTILPPGTQPRDHSQVVAFLDEIWVIAGRSPETRTVAIYDPVTETWRAGPPVNQRRGGFAATVDGQQIMIAGGELLGPPASLARSVEVYAAGSEAWSLAGELPQPVHGVAATTGADGRVYVFGGSTSAGTIGGTNGRSFAGRFER